MMKSSLTDQASIVITIPSAIQDQTTGDAAVPLSADNVKVVARGRVLPSGNLSVGPPAVGDATRL